MIKIIKHAIPEDKWMPTFIFLPDLPDLVIDLGEFCEKRHPDAYEFIAAYYQYYPEALAVPQSDLTKIFWRDLEDCNVLVRHGETEYDWTPDAKKNIEIALADEDYIAPNPKDVLVQSGEFKGEFIDVMDRVEREEAMIAAAAADGVVLLEPRGV